MADSIRDLKLNLPGLNAVLKGQQGRVNRIGQAMATAAGPGFEYEANPNNPLTAVGYVQTGNARARRAEAIEKRLTRSLDAGRNVQ